VQIGRKMIRFDEIWRGS